MLNFRHLCLSKQGCIKTPDVTTQTCVQHIGWHGCLKFTFSNKKYHRVEEPPLQFQKFSETLDVAMILA